MRSFVIATIYILLVHWSHCLPIICISESAPSVSGYDYAQLTARHTAAIEKAARVQRSKSLAKYHGLDAEDQRWFHVRSAGVEFH